MKCRLLFLIGELRAGGSERQLYLLLRSMDRHRYAPHVVVWNYADQDPYASQIKQLGVSVHDFYASESVPTKLRRLRYLVRTLKPEVVQSYSFYLNFIVYLATRGTKAVSLGAIRGDFLQDKKDSGRWIGNLSARWPRTQIANSSLAAQNCKSSRTQFAPKQILVVRNGVDLRQYRWLPLEERTSTLIVGVGSLVRLKRWDRILKAAQFLKQKGCQFRIRLVGEGPLRSELEHSTRSLGIEAHVEFLGYQTDIPTMIAEASFLVHTADTEGCPNVVMEAMACGRAVVAMDAGDIPTLVENGMTGFVVPRNDQVALERAMANLIANPHVCRRMGEAGRAKAEKGFDVNTMVTNMLEAYRQAGWRD